MIVRRAADGGTFAARVEPWLLRHEAEHNLLLGLLPRMRSGDHAWQAPIYLASVEDGDEIVGCAFRTPPFKLGLTRLPAAALDPLVADVGAVYGTLPAVLGEEAAAVGFAERWGRPWRTGTRQRIHATDRVQLPLRMAPGTLRPAQAADVAVLVEWLKAFAAETQSDPGDARAKVDDLLVAGDLHVWDDGGLRAMVAAAGWTAHGVRIGYVYTPPPARGRGYATSAVATLTDRLLRAGRRSCFLYTDLANPTSNRIYARIGYAPVCDVVDVVFT